MKGEIALGRERDPVGGTFSGSVTAERASWAAHSSPGRWNILVGDERRAGCTGSFMSLRRRECVQFRNEWNKQREHLRESKDGDRRWLCLTAQGRAFKDRSRAHFLMSTSLRILLSPLRTPQHAHPSAGRSVSFLFSSYPPLFLLSLFLSPLLGSVNRHLPLRPLLSWPLRQGGHLVANLTPRDSTSIQVLPLVRFTSSVVQGLESLSRWRGLYQDRFERCRKCLSSG